jgi:alpha-1,6-mannosyltransferase
MKIVDVAAFYSPQGGGVKTYIDRKLMAGPAAGHEIVIIAPGPDHRVEERGPGARIIFLDQPRFPLDKNYHYFREETALHAMLDVLQPDIVEASSPWRSARFVGEWPGKAPRALIMHADPLSAYAYRWFGGIASRETIDKQFGWFWRSLLRFDTQFDVTVTAGQSLSDRLIEGGMTNVVTNPMGVADTVFSPALRDEGLRARMLERCELPADATLLLAAGRHAPEKRWPMVVEAVTAAGINAPVGLILIGDGRDRPRVVKAAQDNPHIQLLSPISDRAELARLFASSDALIHGCEAETFCMVAAEARASGLPLIAPDGGGAADQARASGGWTYAWGDPAAAAQAITDFLTSDRAAARARAVEGADTVRTMDDHFHDLFVLYEDIIQTNRIAA